MFPSELTEPYILYTGRIVRMKNITGVLKAFARIQNQIPHRLVITGHGREQVVREFRESKLKEYGIPDDRVLIRGHVSSAEMAALLTRADVLVFPSFYEGFGLPPLEAMAAGCPAIVSHAGSLPEICGDAACYVDPYDPEQIAAAIKRVVSDRAYRQELIAKGTERARRYSWKRSIWEHLRLVHEVRHLSGQEPGPVPVPGGAVSTRGRAMANRRLAMRVSR